MHRRMPSSDEASRHLLKIEGAVAAVHSRHIPGPSEIVWPQGLDRSIIGTLVLKVRTRNSLMSAGLTQGEDQLTVREVWRISNFGKVSLFDLLLTLEAFLLDCINNPRQNHLDFPSPARYGSNKNREIIEHGDKESDFIQQHVEVDPVSTSWKQFKNALGSVLATAVELGAINNTTDALSGRILNIAGALGLRESIESIELQEIIASEVGLVSEITRRINRVLDKMSERQLLILHGRTLAEPVKTLEEIGRNIGVTRERVRQIHKKIALKIDRALGDEIELLSKLLKDCFGHVISEDEFTKRLHEIFPDQKKVVVKILEKLLLSRLGYTKDENYYFDEDAQKFLTTLRGLLSENVDDTGLIAIKELLNLLRDAEWQEHLPWLTKQCGLYEMYGFLALRDSAKARAKAALMSIGRPATKREIMQVCGMSETEIGGAFSNIPSVVRADKLRWGIRDWVDDEYDGIVGEIIQRIDEDGGTTTTKRLFAEIPEKFNVSPSSVRAYLDSPRFEINEGQVRLASHTSLALRHLGDVVDGYSGGGEPYWKFRVEERHFQGYSVTGVPPEFLKALGCQPDDSMQLQLDHVELNHHLLSARWPLATTTGGSFGYVSVPLEALGVTPGDEVRVLIRGEGLVAFERVAGITEQTENGRLDSILEKMKNRRRAL